MNNKKTLILFIITITLCVALVVGATTMLFTWQSGSAKNMMDTGNVHITLYETDQADDPDAVILVPDTTTWTAIDDTAPFIEVSFTSGTHGGYYYPGCTIPKFTMVDNDGHGDAYLRMKVGVGFENEGTTTSSPHWPDSDAHQKLIIEALLKYLNTNGAFSADFIAYPVPGPSDAFETYTDYYFYYADDTLGLTTLESDEQVLFLENGLVLPKYAYWDTVADTIRFSDIGNFNDDELEIYNYLFDVGLTITITAQAVQTYHNGPRVAPTTWGDAFLGDSWTNQQP